MKKILLWVLIIGGGSVVAFNFFPSSNTSRALSSGEGGPVVVELFTSQGCSSCPPADKLLGELAKKDDIVALAWHVTYWDRLGWKDPFGSRQATELQYSYSRTMRRSRVYTPQMIVDGVEDVVGSREREVRSVIRKRRKDGKKAKIGLTLQNNQLLVTLPKAPARQNCEVWVVSYVPEHSTAVERGENGGRTLINYNTVTTAQQIGRWIGEDTEFSVDVSAQLREKNHFAVIARTSGPGQVCAAGKYTTL